MTSSSPLRKELVNFSITVEGQKELDLALYLYRTNIQDLRGVWPDVDEYMRYAIQELFNAEGARGGDKWVALSPAYKVWKDAHFPGRPILYRTGALRQSLINKGGDHIFEPDRMGMTWGSSVPYAKYHQTGTRTMPSRPPIRFLKKEDGERIMKLLQEYIFKSGQGYRRAQV